MSTHIPLRGSTAGRQYAGWEPRAVAMEGLGNRVLADQRVPVASGAELHADVYVPRAPGRYPAVVSLEVISERRPGGGSRSARRPAGVARGGCRRAGRNGCAAA